jgi:hypothetical protein
MEIAACPGHGRLTPGCFLAIVKKKGKPVTGTTRLLFTTLLCASPLPSVIEVVPLNKESGRAILRHLDIGFDADLPPGTFTGRNLRTFRGYKCAHPSNGPEGTFMLTFKIALRNLLRQKRRTLFTGLSMLVGFVLSCFFIGRGR